MSDIDAESFERSLPYQFRSLLIELGALVTPGGQRIIIYRGFKPVATRSIAEAEQLSLEDEAKLRNVFKRWYI